MRISDWSSDVCSSDLAVPGDRICARGDLIFVNGKPVTERLKIDARGRAMPWWRGCVRLGITQFLLLMTDSPASFDGRYFGPSERRDVIGRDRQSTRLNSSHYCAYRMPYSA